MPNNNHFQRQRPWASLGQGVAAGMTNIAATIAQLPVLEARSRETRARAELYGVETAAKKTQMLVDEAKNTRMTQIIQEMAPVLARAASNQPIPKEMQGGIGKYLAEVMTINPQAGAGMVEMFRTLPMEGDETTAVEPPGTPSFSERAKQNPRGAVGEAWGAVKGAATGIGRFLFGGSDSSGEADSGKGLGNRVPMGQPGVGQLKPTTPTPTDDEGWMTLPGGIKIRQKSLPKSDLGSGMVPQQQQAGPILGGLQVPTETPTETPTTYKSHPKVEALRQHFFGYYKREPDSRSQLVTWALNNNYIDEDEVQELLTAP